MIPGQPPARAGAGQRPPAPELPAAFLATVCNSTVPFGPTANADTGYGMMGGMGCFGGYAGMGAVGGMGGPGALQCLNPKMCM